MSDDGSGAESEASWFEYVDSDTDMVYYHNPSTGESRWTNPYAPDEEDATDAEPEGTAPSTPPAEPASEAEPELESEPEPAPEPEPEPQPEPEPEPEPEPAYDADAEPDADDTAAEAGDGTGAAVPPLKRFTPHPPPVPRTRSRGYSADRPKAPPAKAGMIVSREVEAKNLETYRALLAGTGGEDTMQAATNRTGQTAFLSILLARVLNLELCASDDCDVLLNRSSTDWCYAHTTQALHHFDQLPEEDEADA